MALPDWIEHESGISGSGSGPGSGSGSFTGTGTTERRNGGRLKSVSGA
jgi:hypothetical protein